MEPSAGGQRKSSRRNAGQPAERLGTWVLDQQHRKGIQTTETPTETPPEEISAPRSRPLEEVEDYGSQRAASVRSSGRSRVTGSGKSSSLRRAKLQIEMTAAEELAEIELAKLKIKENLLKKKTEIQMHEVEAEDSDNSQKLSDSEDDNWSLPPPRNHRQRRVASPPPAPVSDGLTQLAQAITQAIGNVSVERAPAASGKGAAPKLPRFDGDTLEWPAFISQYNSTTKLYRLTKEDNVIRLRYCLEGAAKECVKALLVSPENVETVLHMLEMNFGRPRMIIKKLVDKAKKLDRLSDGNWKQLLTFSNVIRNLVETMRSLKCEHHMLNPQLLDELAEKLPSQFRFDWMAFVRKHEDANLEDFSGFVTSIAETAAMMTDRNSGDDKPKKKERVFLSKEKKDNACHFCGQSGHWISSCEKFLELDQDERWKVTMEKRICYCCLIPGHQAMKCRKKKPCGKDGCTQFHHQLLHKSSKKEEKREQGHSLDDEDNTSHLPYIPVILSSGEKEVKVFAFLDDGCTSTLVEQNVVDLLELTGRKDPLSLQLVKNKHTDEEDSKRVNFSIRGDYDGARSFDISGARTISKLGIAKQTIDYQKLKQKYSYLDGLPVQSYFNERPSIIIGQANKLLSLSRRFVHGKEGQPVAEKTWLGWVISGKLPDRNSADGSYVIREEVNSDEILHQLVKESFSTEAFGVKIIHEKARSREDKRAIELLEKNTKKVGDCYETGLLWRSDNPEIPHTYHNALNRLKSQERKMDKDPKFASLYLEKISEYFQKGYVKKLTKEEIFCEDAKINYLPHFGVYNPNKPGKIRLVFDAASKNGGVSLNDLLLQGPDLLNPLPAVLMRFRKRRIGFSADITDMFHRIKIRKEDLSAQRFLFRGMDRDRSPDVYQMNVMLFGATCSPSAALYVKNLNAEENREEYPAAYNAIVNQFYMDDYLDSADTEDEATQLINEVIHVNKLGNFTLCKWISSAKEVIEKIPIDLRAEGLKEVTLTETEIPLGRALGIWWDPEEDVFTFKAEFHKVTNEVLSGDKVPTKREVLQLLMSIFDPLGFIAHFTVRGKMILQLIWNSGVAWDEEIPENLHGKWSNWIRELTKIVNLKIPRCYSLKIPRAESIQLHIFMDSSQLAFACSAYLRVEADGEVDVVLVAARTRVAPLKPMSIPRLELQAAVAGSRLGACIRQNIGIEIHETYHHTDSRTVLCWIKAEARRFKQFVAHRIGEIAELTDIASWRWVPTAENVDDDATRDEKECDLTQSSRWFTGPNFLKEDPSKWPVLLEVSLPTAVKQEEELKKDFLGVIVEVMLFKMEDYSSWTKLVGVTGWMLRFLNKTSKKTFAGSTTLSIIERRKAEIVLVKMAQRTCFYDEISALSKNNQVSNSSRLLKLSPFLDNSGVLRMRTKFAQAIGIPEREKYPIILDGRDHLVKLLVSYYHNTWAHGGRGIVMNELRRKYWIIGASNIVKKTISGCLVCRKRKVKPVIPEMGNIPDAKLAVFCRPFTFCGVDCWGPIEVTVKRSREKRYGMIFTCLTTRAIHLELVGSLSTDSCIQAILRMRARRGTPQVIISDNGTNFVGANRELSTAAKEIPRELEKHGIEWRFNPPGAPHMGGSWERLIRSVKVTLGVILKDQAPKEELLRTVITEAEYIVNNRPLTDVAVDYNSPRALTPIDFLIGPDRQGEAERTDVICLPNVDGKDLKRMWCTSQWYAEQFWKRWRTEYLPTLARREKWNKTSPPIAVNDVVIVVEPLLERNLWPLGVVTAVYSRKGDQAVRVVDVRIVKNGGKQTFKILRRPVSRICLLEKAEESGG